jgi:hypothetical protein
MPLLEKITLSHNLIQSIVGFENVPKLREINLKDNNIHKFEDDETLPELAALEVLNLSENNISKMPEIKKLLFYATLTDLNVLQNPVGDPMGAKFKREVLMMLPRLERVNGDSVQVKDREEALEEAAARHKKAEDERLEAERKEREAAERENEDD